MPDRRLRLFGWLRSARSLHFLIGGVLLHLAISGSSQPPQEPLRISAEAQARLRAGWVAATGRQPSDAEFAAELRRELDDEILFREAIAAGLHARDTVVRQRLIMNMRFLDPSSTADEDTLVAGAERMEMHLNDLVVRRRLVQLMEFALSDDPGDSPVSDAEAREMYQTRKDELRLPARWRVQHVYFSAERRGQRAADDAVAAATALNVPGSKADPATMGDPFLGGRELPLLTANQLEGQFGSGFVDALGRCQPLVWCAPVSSSFGQHAVLLEEIVPERLPPIDDPTVRARIDSDVHRQRAAARLEHSMRNLRIKYGVVG